MAPWATCIFECCCVYILTRENTSWCGIQQRLGSAAGTLGGCRLDQNCFVISTQQSLGMVCISVVIRTLAGIIWCFISVVTLLQGLHSLGGPGLRISTVLPSISGSWSSMRLLFVPLLKYLLKVGDRSKRTDNIFWSLIRSFCLWWMGIFVMLE